MALTTDLKARIRRLLTEACTQVGLEAADARLLGYSMNAVYLLRAAPVVVRLRRGDPIAVDQSVATARWLTDSDAPTVRLQQGLHQPVQVEDYVATFWEAAEQTGERFLGGDLAPPLRELHSLEPAHDLPIWDPFQYIRGVVGDAGWLSEDDRDWLSSECARLEASYNRSKLGMRHGLIHANAKVKNVLRDTSDRLILCDLDSVARGPLLFDLVPTAVNAIRLGRSLDHHTLAYAYGVDVMQEECWPILRRVRELETVAFWITQGDTSARVVAEVGHRLRCLRRGDSESQWRSYRQASRTASPAAG